MYAVKENVRKYNTTHKCVSFRGLRVDMAARWLFTCTYEIVFIMISKILNLVVVILFFRGLRVDMAARWLFTCTYEIVFIMISKILNLVVVILFGWLAIRWLLVKCLDNFLLPTFVWT